MDTPYQICPLCASPAALGAARCACGHPLAVDSVDAHPPEELYAQAEALYQTYLAARVVRAQEAVRTAKVDVIHDPRDRTKALELKRAEEAFQILQAELSVQTIKTEQARRALARAWTSLGADSPPALSQAPEATTAGAAPDRFRAAQSAKAARLRPVPETNNLLLNDSTAAIAAERAEAPKVECANCGGLNLHGTQCSCGFDPAPGPQLPPILLSDEESALLRDVNLTRRTPTKS